MSRTDGEDRYARVAILGRGQRRKGDEERLMKRIEMHKRAMAE